MSLRFLVMEGSPAHSANRFREGYGRSPAEHYGDTLVALHGAGAYDIVRAADPDGRLPQGAQLGDYDGVVITGSPLNLWKQEPESMRQVALAREIFEAKVPFFGSCWGLQVAAVAAGGTVHLNPRGREFGFARRISPTSDGARHALLAGRSAFYDAPCAHQDEVATLPAGSTILASNGVSRVQAAEIRHAGGTFWGVQYHPEFGPDVLAYILDQYANDLVSEGFFAEASQSSAYCADLRMLAEAPDRKDISWRLGLNPDVLDQTLRTIEITNFIAHCQLESGRRRAA
ncbi:GuaA GMP synthase - Glutamine amidotransferase domain [Rhabdaerophilaceae bacterium]